VGKLDHMIYLHLFWGTKRLFFKQWFHFTFPLAVSEEPIHFNPKFALTPTGIPLGIGGFALGPHS
jgi:hypothetical protein